MFAAVQSRRFRIVLIVSLLLLLALLWWRLASRTVFSVIPAQTALTLAFSDVGSVDSLFQLSAKNNVSFTLLGWGRQDLRTALAIFSRDSIPGNQLPAGPLVAAFSLQSSDGGHPLFAMDVGQRLDLKALTNQYAPDDAPAIIQFKGHQLYTFESGPGQKLYAATTKNILLFSIHSFLVEDALLQADEGNNWWSDQKFPALSPYVPVQIIIRMDALATRLAGQVRSEWASFTTQLPRQLEWLSLYREVTAWKVRAEKPVHSNIGVGDREYQDALFEVLPDNTALVMPLVQSESVGGRDEASFSRFVEPWAGRGANLAILEPYASELQENQLLIFRVRDEKIARALLNDFGNQTGILKQNTYQTYEITQFLDNSLISPWLDSREGLFENPACVQLNGFVIFGTSPSALELLIDRYIVNQTLLQNPDFLLLHQKMTGAGSTLFYANTAFLPQLLSRLFPVDVIEAWRADLDLLQQNGLVSATVSENAGKSLSGALHVQASKHTAMRPGLLWKTALHGEAITRPFIVSLPGAGLEPACLIQDNQFQLYRLALNGRILWRKQLNMPVVSAVYALDYYKNEQYCFLFNTPDAIWMLDDTGQEISGYPLTLQSPATNGVTLVQFGGDGALAFFIACSNGNLYGFDQFGRPLNGWNPQSGVGRIIHPLTYLSHGGKDYLASLSLSGELAVFNRDGSAHFPNLQLEGTFLQSPLQVDTVSKSPRFVCMNSGGQVFVSNLSGEHFILESGSAKDGDIPYLALEHILGDPRKDYAILEGKRMTLSGYSGAQYSQKHQVVFPSSQDTVFSAGCCQKLGTLDREKRQVFLVDAAGTVHAGFPLAGTTPFSLEPLSASMNKAYILVVGNRSEVFAYKIH